MEHFNKQIFKESESWFSGEIIIVAFFICSVVVFVLFSLSFKTKIDRDIRKIKETQVQISREDSVRVIMHKKWLSQLQQELQEIDKK